MNTYYIVDNAYEHLLHGQRYCVCYRVVHSIHNHDWVYEIMHGRSESMVCTEVCVIVNMVHTPEMSMLMLQGLIEERSVDSMTYTVVRQLDALVI